MKILRQNSDTFSTLCCHESRSRYEFYPRNLSTINTHFSSQSYQESVSCQPFIPLTLTSEPRVISNAKNRMEEDTPSSRAAATKREIPILCLKRVKNIHTIKDVCAEDVVRAHRAAALRQPLAWRNQREKAKEKHELNWTTLCNGGMGAKKKKGK